ncbi:hypothetical protein G7K_0070-t2 [Saitoella complicata NRRL Y-17804]|uniref:DNA ligase n=1 Tax=Saitoella complicata (strain BCRC 22490 / CBS 7301 / JCM 7358 / NBRC 10748 / NRRL Y-17804) TaxID=698492 RepID=A0A0E9N7X2_SAICN|nr:hypothetical protein G7K_0070-t2 [Saitoella complicata NRRL Y-17804]
MDPEEEARLDEEYPNRPKNDKHSLPFRELIMSVFEPLLRNVKKPTAGAGRGRVAVNPAEVRKKIIQTFIQRWRKGVGADIYPAFRLIMPDRDRNRLMYGIKESALSKILPKVLSLSPDSEDAQSLRGWKAIQDSKRTAGDFAGRCYEVISKRPAVTEMGDLTIDQVNNLLDQLSRVSKEDEQRVIITEFYKRMSPVEMKWLIRIILRQMKIGATEKTFFDQWHPDAERLFNVCSSLRRVCWELYDPGFRLEGDKTELQLNQCFQPQLCSFQKRDFASTVESLGRQHKTFWIEEKLDGERIQMHYDRGNYKFFSRLMKVHRKGKDYTDMYGARADDPTAGFTKHLAGVFSDNIQNLILDGEMVTWDPIADRMVAFGTLKSAAKDEQVRETSDNAGHRPFYLVYDILYLNGKSLCLQILSQRRDNILGKMVEQGYMKEIKRRFELHRYVEGRAVKDVEVQFRRVVEQGSEGLILKDPDSIYIPSSRSGKWVKIKPEYMKEFGENLDLLVLGGYYGGGRRGGTLSSFMCGLRIDDPNEPGEPVMKFWSFCRVGGGFRAEDYAKIRHETEGAWQKWDTRNPPTHVMELAGNQTFQRPDEWIMPDKSFVIQVKAAQIIASDEWKTGLSLRFPRFQRFRPDRDWTNALNWEDFLELKNQAAHEQEERKLEVQKKRVRTSRSKQVFTVYGAEGHDEVVKNQYGAATSEIFKDLSFYVMTEMVAPKKESKVALEALLRDHLAHIFQSENASPDVNCIADRNLVKVAALVKRGKHDIIKPAWVLDSIEAGYPLPLEPRYIYFATEQTVREMKENVDEFGDSYTTEIKVEELSNVLDNVNVDIDKVGDREEIIRDFMEEYGEEEVLPGWLFARCTVYLDTPQLGQKYGLAEASQDGKREDVNRLYLVSTTLAFAGAHICTDFYDNDITHVVVDPSDRSRLRKLRARLALRDKQPRVVSAAWVEECWKEKTLLDEEAFGV